MGLDNLIGRLNHIALPEGQEEILEKRYAHIRCPEHHASVKVMVDRGRRAASFSYCCERLKDLVGAERDRLHKV